VAAASFTKRRPIDMLAICSQISLFSTSEITSKLLTTEDTNKMSVVDLKEELKKRGASQQGKNADLLQRLNELLEKENCSPAGEKPNMFSNDKDVGTRAAEVHFQTQRRDINRAPVFHKVSSTANQAISLAEFQLEDEFQKLDLALNQKNLFLFEESMKRMESAIRSNRELRLSSKEKNLLASKLRVWTKMDSVDSESIAHVLTSAGYLGLSIRPTDENREVIERIIDKYLQEEIKSPSSITNFLWGLNKVGLEWHKIPQETQWEIETALVQSIKHMNVEDLSSFLKICSSLSYRWYQKKEISESVIRNVFNEGNPLHSMQNRLTTYINELTDIGFPWVAVPENVKLIIFQEMKSQIFHPEDLPKLFSG
jgi:hypothetical protein